MCILHVFVTSPVSIHPATIKGMKNTMKKKNNTEATSVCWRVFVFSPPCLYMLVPVLLTSPERENKEGREEGRMKERGEKKREDTQLTRRPNQLLLLFSPFSEDGGGGRWGGLQNGGRLVSMFPFCKMTPVDSQQSQTWFFWRFAQAIKNSSSVKTVMECANTSLCAHK